MSRASSPSSGGRCGTAPRLPALGDPSLNGLRAAGASEPARVASSEA